MACMASGPLKVLGPSPRWHEYNLWRIWLAPSQRHDMDARNEPSLQIREHVAAAACVMLLSMGLQSCTLHEDGFNICEASAGDEHC